MTATEILDELDDSYGPCTKICISCPAGEFLKEIRDVILGLLAENKELRWELEGLAK